MKNVETKIMRTPTEGNRDCEWSVGVMNLTRAEADIVASFARGVRSINSPRAMGLTASDMARGTFMGEPVENVARLIDENRRRQGATRGPPPVNDYTAARSEIEQLRQKALDAELAMNAEDRKRYLTGRWSPDIDDAKQPEPEEPRNRFSGLELPDEKA